MWVPWRTKESSAPALYTEADMRYAMSEMLEEAQAAAERTLAIDSTGWSQIGQGVAPLTEEYRSLCVRQSRVLRRRDSMCKHLIKLWTDFGVGTGFTWQAKSPFVKDTLTEMWEAPINRYVFSVQGQRALSTSLCTDGELFLAIFEGSPPVVRRLDSLEISLLALDPEDAFVERVYVREGFTAQHKQYRYAYRSTDNEDGLPGVDWKGDLVPPDQPGVVVHHVRLEGVSGHGDPLLMPVIEWAMADRNFMRARLAIIQEIGKIARKYTVKGGPRAVQAEQARQEARQATRYQGQPPEQGVAYVANDAIDTKALPPETGASNANTDEAMIVRRATLGASVFPHYAGFGEAFRLATATAMEPPMLKNFQVYQMLMKSDVFMAIFDSVLAPFGISARQEVEIDPVEIWPSDVSNNIKAITDSVATFPQFRDAEPVLEKVLSLCGFTNPSGVLEDIRANAPETPPKPEPVAQPVQQQEAADVTRLLKELRHACGGSL